MMLLPSSEVSSSHSREPPSEMVTCPTGGCQDLAGSPLAAPDGSLEDRFWPSRVAEGFRLRAGNLSFGGAS